MQEPSEPVHPQPLATVSLLPDASGPYEIVANPETGYVYVASGHVGQVAVFSGNHLVTVLTTDEQSRPTIAIDQQRNWTYITNEYGDSVSIIRDEAVVETLDVGGRLPSGVSIDPNTGRAYVVSGYAKDYPPEKGLEVEGNVTVLNGPEIETIIPLGKETLATLVTVDPVDGYVYVGAVLGDVVVIKDLQEVARYNLEYTPDALDANQQTGEVYVLSPTGLHRFQEGELRGSLHVEGEGGSADNMIVHPTTGDAYVIDVVRQEIVVVRPEDNTMYVIGRVPVDYGPTGLVADPFTGNVYVSNVYDNTVTAIHGTEVIAVYQVGRYPYAVGVNPANGWVYVANTNEHTVSILGFEE